MWVIELKKSFLNKSALIDQIEKQAKVGYWVLQLATETTIWSEGTYRIYGIDPGKPSPSKTEYFQLVHPDDVEYVQSKVVECIPNGNCQFSQRIIRPDGTVRVVHSNVVTGYENGQPVNITGTCQDITELHEAKESLAKANSNLKAVVKSIKDILFQFDENERFLTVWVSDPSRLFMPEDVFIGKTIREVFADEFGEYFSENFKTVLKTGKTIKLEYQHPADKRYYIATISRVIDPVSGAKTITAAISDITEKFELQQKLQINEQRWAFALENANQGVWDWDVENNTVFYSDTWKKLLGYEPHEISDTLDEWATRVHPEDLPKAKQKIEKHINEETRHYYIEFRMRHKFGHYVWIISHGKIIERTAEGKPKRFIGTHTDISKLKKAEAEVRRLALVAERTINGVLITDTQGRITWVNKSFEQISKYSMDELAGKKPEDLLSGPKTKQKTINDIAKAIAARETFRGEVYNYSKDGSGYWVYLSLTPIYENGKWQGYISVETDISEKKRTEEKLSRSEKMLKKAQETAKIGHWYFDVINNTLEWSEETKNIHDVAVDFSPNVATAINFYHPESVAKIQAAFKKALLGEPYNLDLKIISAAGIEKHIRTMGRPEYEGDKIIGVSGIFMDITREKEVEILLRESENRLNEAQILAAIGSWEYLVRKDEVIMSKGMARIWETEEMQFSREQFLNSVHPDDVEKLKEYIQASIVDSKKYDLLHRIVTPNGTIKYIHAKADVVLNRAGFVRAVRGTSQDVTEKVRYEQELIAAKERAEKASHSKAEFLSMMSHEIRTPLNAVIGMTHLLRQENPRDDQIENLNTLKFSAENLLVLINDILDFNKIEAGKIEFEENAFDVARLVESICHAMSFKAEEQSNRLLTKIGKTVPKVVVGDAIRLNQVLTNLINNALKFTEKGNVTVSVKNLGIKNDFVKLLFSVRDTGIGIEKENLSRIFESFTQARSNISRMYGGSGLGLAITKRLLELQDSQIFVKSEVGKGSEFSFVMRYRVPLNQILKTEETSFVADTFSSLKGTRVLLAEDNRVNIRVAQKFLNKWDIEVDTAENGKIALEKARLNNYSVILMDLQMPEMDGLEATRQIRNLDDSRYSTVPIIALTASALMETKRDVYTAGMNDYITKPFNPAELYRKLKKYSV